MTDKQTDFKMDASQLRKNAEAKLSAKTEITAANPVDENS